MKALGLLITFVLLFLLILYLEAREARSKHQEDGVPSEQQADRSDSVQAHHTRGVIQ